MKKHKKDDRIFVTQNIGGAFMMKKERKKLRVELVDEDMILLKVPDKGIVEWKILQVSKDFVEFAYTLDDVEFHSGEWNDSRGEYIRRYVLDPKSQKIWRATVAYPNTLVNLKHKRPVVFYSYGKPDVRVIENCLSIRQKETDKKEKFYQIRYVTFSRVPMQSSPVVFFAESGKTYELKVVEL